MSIDSLSTLATALQSVPDPRSKQDVSHPYHDMLALVLLGLIAQLPTVAASLILTLRPESRRRWSLAPDSTTEIQTSLRIVYT